MEKGKKEIQEFWMNCLKRKKRKGIKEWKTWKLFKKFLNDNKGDVKKILKIKKYNKRPMHMMVPILDDVIYELMSEYDLEKFEGTKSIFNGFSQINISISISVFN